MLKIIANLCTDFKGFIDYLSQLKKLANEGNQTALICIKNLGYNLDDYSLKKYFQHIDFRFVEKHADSEQGLMVLRQCASAGYSSMFGGSKEQEEWFCEFIKKKLVEGGGGSGGSHQSQAVYILANMIFQANNIPKALEIIQEHQVLKLCQDRRAVSILVENLKFSKDPQVKTFMKQQK